MKTALIISCFDWYEKRLKPIRELLIQNNYQVTVLESDFDHINKKALTCKYPECTYIHVPEYHRNLSISRIASHLTFSRKVRKHLRNNKPDLIYCLIPLNSLAYECKRYKSAHPDTSLIFDVIDLWPESLPLSKFKNIFPIKIWKNLRDGSLNVANHVFTECDMYISCLKSVVATEKCSPLYLFKNQNDEEKKLVKEIIISNSYEGNIIKFAYLGSMNNIIDIDGICKVINRYISKGYMCELHAIGDGESKDLFREKIEHIGCLAYFYGVVFDEIEKIKILAPCHYALNILKENVSVGLTIKSIDYFSYALPIINNIKGDTWSFVKTQSIGFNVDLSSVSNLEHYEFDRLKIYDFFCEHFTNAVFISSVKSKLD